MVAISDQKLSPFHDLFAVEPDIKVPPNAIDVGLRYPVLPGMLRVGMTEGDMDARDFFVLQNVPDDIRAGSVRADGELAHAIAVFVCACVKLEIVAQIL